jgi:hypothetical protein
MPSDFHTALDGANLIYIASHGTSPPAPQSFQSGNGLDIWDYNILSRRQSAIPSGQLPPANSSGIPPFNIVWSDTCSMEFFNLSSAFLWPSRNQYAPVVENQSYFGYDVAVPILFPWYDLAQFTLARWWVGDTAHKVRDFAAQAIVTIGWQAQYWPSFHDSHLVQLGNPHTRMRDVYTSDDSLPSTSWYGRIQ